MGVLWKMAVVLVICVNIFKLEIPSSNGNKPQWKKGVATTNLRSNNNAVNDSSNGLRQVAKPEGISGKSPVASNRSESDVEVEELLDRETPKKPSMAPSSWSTNSSVIDATNNQSKAPSNLPTNAPTVAEKSVGDVIIPHATSSIEHTTIDKVQATEQDEDRQNESNQTLDKNQIAQSVENPREKWEKLWKEKVEVYSNAISEDEKRSVAEKKILAFNHSESNFWPLDRLMETFPTPTREDSLAIYNEDTYNRLISRLLEAQSSNRTFKIVASGGSTTAGAGSPSLKGPDRYFARFTDYLKRILSIDDASSAATIEYIDQGHGSRNSLHTAVLYDNFVPADVDLLIWEFSINDVAIDRAEKNKTIKEITARQSFLALMNRINSLENPPFVMLLYYWNGPWSRDKADCSVFGSSFKANGDLARHFDFVVGHGNMASYTHELELKSGCTRQTNPFVIDSHHPSRMGHMTSAFLLLHLLRPNGTFLKPPPSSSVDASHEWTCGTETQAKQTLKSVITNSTGGWKSPVGTWTLELPVYNQASSSATTVLIPARPNVNIEQAGRAEQSRQDRQRSTPLGLCSGSSEDAFSLLVDNSRNSKPMQNVRAILFSLRYKKKTRVQTEHIRVQFNDNLNASSGELVPMYIASRKDDPVYNWRCDFSCPCAWGGNVDMYWYILDSVEPSVHSLKICSTTFESITIQNLAIW